MFARRSSRLLSSAALDLQADDDDDCPQNAAIVAGGGGGAESENSKKMKRVTQSRKDAAGTKAKPKPKAGSSGTNLSRKRKQHDSDSDSEESTRGSSGSPHKKHAVGGVRGTGNVFCDIPVDMLFEMFSWLRPVDVLYMSRTSKRLRAFFMSRSSSELIWKAARLNIPGLPECPEDLSELKYAHLCFISVCHGCWLGPDEGIDEDIYWKFRARLCHKCLMKKYRSAKPYVLLGKSSTSPGYPLIILKESCNERELYCPKTANIWEAQYARAKDKKKWAEDKEREMVALNTHASACERWKKNSMHKIIEQKGELKVERAKFILNRPKDGKWAEEYHHVKIGGILQETYIRDLCEKAEMPERALLKLEPVFNESILPELDLFIDKWMETRKRERLQRIMDARNHKRFEPLKKLLRSYFSTLPVNTVVPSIGDMVFHPHIKDLILRAPDSEFEQPNPLPGLDAMLPDITQTVLSEIEVKLINLIASSSGEYYAFDRKTVLTLATTVFSCVPCSQNRPWSPPKLSSDMIRYPRVIIHVCATSMTSPAPQRILDGIDLQILKEITRDTPWNLCSQIKFSTENMLLLSDVVSLCGFDPLTTTAAEMDAADPVLECLSCNDIHKGRVMMRWSVVPLHKRRDHKTDGVNNTTNPMDLAVLSLDGSEAKAVRLRMDEEEQRKQAAVIPPVFNGVDTSNMVCVHCKKQSDLGSLLQHVKIEHNILEPQRTDIVAKLDSDSARDIFYFWPPRV